MRYVFFGIYKIFYIVIKTLFSKKFYKEMFCFFWTFHQPRQKRCKEIKIIYDHWGYEIHFSKCLNCGKLL